METLILIILFLLIGYFFNFGEKTQFVRMLHFFLYGPFLIWLSTKFKKRWIKITLLFMGAITISYNLKNYLREENVNLQDSAITNPASW